MVAPNTLMSNVARRGRRIDERAALGQGAGRVSRTSYSARQWGRRRLALRGVDVGVWFYLGIAVFVVSLPLAKPVAWWRYVRTGHEPSGDQDYAEVGDFHVILRASGTRSFEVVKAVREVSGAGIVEAKSKVDIAPTIIAVGLSEASATRVRARLERAGATATVAEGSTPDSIRGG
jgi:ribosomal protein L7/L12